MSGELLYVYRGVHARHPALELARRGTVIPASSEQNITPEEHNLLDASAFSPFTSWTYSIDIAIRFANRRGPGGVVLRLLKQLPEPDDSWSWVDSPDIHNEREVLLHGSRIGIEVLVP